MSELEELCKPLITYLRENYNPYTEVVVTADDITLKQSIEGIPLKKQAANTY